MSAPLVELLIRTGTALMATVAFAMLLVGWHARVPGRPLLCFMAVVVGLQMVWRWFILWLGFQTDLGHFAWMIPWIQPITASLLFLLLLAIALIAWFHAIRFYPSRGGS